MVARKLEEIRKANKTREWDVGKDGQMSQEEWVEKKREERVEEFAPPASLNEEGSGEGKGRRQIGGRRDPGRERGEGMKNRQEIEGQSGQRIDERGQREMDAAGQRKYRCSFEGGFDKHGRREIGEGMSERRGNEEDKGWSIIGFNEPTNRRHADEYAKNSHSRRSPNQDGIPLTDEQLMTQLEEDETQAASSMYCFKRKWSDQNVLRRYQKPESGKGKSSETPLVDTRFINNSARKAEVVNPIVDSRFVRNDGVKKAKVHSGKDEMEVGVRTDYSEKETTKTDTERKMDTQEIMNAQEVNKGLVGPPVPSELLTERKLVVETMSKENGVFDEKNMDEEIEDDEMIGPPIPTELKAKQTDEDLIGPPVPIELATNEINQDLIGPPIPTKLAIKETTLEPLKTTTSVPKDMGEYLIGPPVQTEANSKETSEEVIEPPVSNQVASEPIGKASEIVSNSTQLIPTHIGKKSKSPLIPSKLVPRQAAKNPLIPASLRPKQMTSQYNAFLNTGKLPCTRKEKAVETSKTDSTPLSENNEKSTIKTDAVPKTEDEFKANSEETTSKSNDYFRKIFEDSKKGSVESSEKSTDSNKKDTDTNETESASNTTFNFLDAKSKTDRLKRKLDRPNVQFNDSGQIVNKKTSGPDLFRSQTRGPEGETNSRDEPRSASKKFVEIAPPSSMEYFTSASSFSSRGKKRGGASGPGSGRGMLEAVRKGMEKVEKEKKSRAGKKEKGLLDIM